MGEGHAPSFPEESEDEGNDQMDHGGRRDLSSVGGNHVVVSLEGGGLEGGGLEGATSLEICRKDRLADGGSRGRDRGQGMGREDEVDGDMENRVVRCVPTDASDPRIP